MNLADLLAGTERYQGAEIVQDDPYGIEAMWYRMAIRDISSIID